MLMSHVVRVENNLKKKTLELKEFLIICLSSSLTWRMFVIPNNGCSTTAAFTLVLKVF